MIYSNAVEQVRGAKPKELNILRLATVTSLTSGGRAYVKFFGESTASSKLYPYLEGYRPTVGDTVLMFEQGSTFIIGGKVSKEDLSPLATYLTKAEADGYYLPLSAAEDFAPLEHFHAGLHYFSNNVHLWAMWITSDGTLIASKQTGVGSMNFGNSANHWGIAYIDQIGTDNYDHAVHDLYVRNIKNYGNMLPSATNTRSIGSTSLKYKEGYFTALGGDSDSNSIQNLYVKSLKNYGDMLPSATNTRSIGSTSLKYKVGYFNDLGGNSSSNAIQNAYLKSTTIYGDIAVDTSNSYSIGAAAKYLSNVYSNKIYTNNIYIGISSSSSSQAYLSLVGGQSYPQINPSTNQTIDLGYSSRQYRNVYAKQFYQNGTAISTSDRRKKTNIKDIAKKYIDFFKRLKPRSFRFKDGDSGRTHTGFIAQEVEEAAAESSINNKDLAFLCIDEEGNYGLRYEELIAIQTQVIQDLMARVERLENIVKERA